MLACALKRDSSALGRRLRLLTCGIKGGVQKTTDLLPTCKFWMRTKDPIRLSVGSESMQTSTSLGILRSTFGTLRIRLEAKRKESWCPQSSTLRSFFPMTPFFSLVGKCSPVPPFACSKSISFVSGFRKVDQPLNPNVKNGVVQEYLTFLTQAENERILSADYAVDEKLDALDTVHKHVFQNTLYIRGGSLNFTQSMYFTFHRPTIGWSHA